MNEPLPDRMTVAEAAAYLRVSIGTIYSLCQNSRLEHFRIGLGRGTIRIKKEALDALLREGRQKPAPATARRVTLADLRATY